MPQRPLRCLITGANTGLGFEVAKQLLLRGHEVILACRSPEKGRHAVQQLQQLTAAGQPRSTSGAAATSGTNSNSLRNTTATVTAVQCDLASFASVRSCAAAVTKQWPQLDVLVCNAAVIPPSSASTTVDGINEQLQVNHLSHFLLVDLLLPCLIQSSDTPAGAAAADQPSVAAEQHHQNAQQQQQQQCDLTQTAARSRVVVVGSGQHSNVPQEWQDPRKLQLLMPGASTSQQPQQQQALLPPMQLYSLTKLCNLWFVRYLAQHVLAATGGRVVANVVAPGFIPTTDLGRHLAGSFIARFFMKFIMSWAPFAVTVQEGAQCVVSLCLDEDTGRTSGQFYSRRQISTPSNAAQDDNHAAVCWWLSCEATEVSGEVYGGLKVQQGDQ